MGSEEAGKASASLNPAGLTSGPAVKLDVCGILVRRMLLLEAMPEVTKPNPHFSDAETEVWKGAGLSTEHSSYSQIWSRALSPAAHSSVLPLKKT